MSTPRTPVLSHFIQLSPGITSFFTSASRSWRQMFLGRPLFHFTSGFHVKSCHVTLSLVCVEYDQSISSVSVGHNVPSASCALSYPFITDDFRPRVTNNQLLTTVCILVVIITVVLRLCSVKKEESHEICKENIS